MTKNIFVFGLDDFNLAQLETIRRAEDYRFHELFRHAEVKAPRVFPVEMLLREGRRRLRTFPGSVDAIVGYWDFPVSTMLPLLRAPFGSPSPTFEAVLKCEHKYWSRLEQRRVVPEHIPDFCAFDPFSSDVRRQIALDYPFWIKPVKSASSHLGFEVRDSADLEDAIVRIRQGIFRYARPFDYLLGFADLPGEIAFVDGNHCIAEAMISEGEQCTLEGFVQGGHFEVYGVVDSIRQGERGSSFSRYQYPSRLPAPVRSRMIEIARRFLAHIGYDDSPFNAELFWNPDTDDIWLLEVNTRISKSHTPLFYKVDGAYHHEVMLDVALGRRPDFPHRQGRYRHAAKFMWRRSDDAVVTRVPTSAELRRIVQQIDSAEVQLQVREGTRLAEMQDQDSYTHEVAVIFLGGDSEQELLDKYRACQEAMQLHFESVGRPPLEGAHP